MGEKSAGAQKNCSSKSKMPLDLGAPNDKDWFQSDTFKESDLEDNMPCNSKRWKRKASKVLSPLITVTKTPSPQKRRRHWRKEVACATAPPTQFMAANIEGLNAMSDLGATLSLLQSLGLTLQPTIKVPHVYSEVVTSNANLESQLLSCDTSSTESSDCEARTPKEKANRIRVAARNKVKKANALAENRKKVGLKPYIINIDAYCRQNGPHWGL